MHAHFLQYILHTPTESFQLGGREGVIIAITSGFLGCSTVHTIIVMCQLKLNSKYNYYIYTLIFVTHISIGIIIIIVL